MIAVLRGLWQHAQNSGEKGIRGSPPAGRERMPIAPAWRKLMILAFLAALWQAYSMWVNNPLLFPSFKVTVTAFWDALTRGELLLRTWNSMKLLVAGYAAGVILAVILTAIAMNYRLGADFLELATAMMNPLPAIALLPVALIWFGLGQGSMIFVLTHSVLWPVSLNTYAGFRGVSNTLRMVGQNYGLNGRRYIAKILVPAAFPAIVSGLKIGWAFAWRTLIAAELAFGASSGRGGLGWFIYENKNQLELAYVFAGLFTVILVGLGIENLVFRTIEGRTVKRWGMSQ